MTPDRMAALHAACFTVPRPWSTQEISDLLTSPLVFALTESAGFALGRAAADEAELLTLAVDPAKRRQGTGTRLLAAFLDTARERKAVRAFLEVAADNSPAIALYLQAGFTQCGRRRGYYRPVGGPPVDAVVMERAL